MVWLLYSILFFHAFILIEFWVSYWISQLIIIYNTNFTVRKFIMNILNYLFSLCFYFHSLGKQEKLTISIKSVKFFVYAIYILRLKRRYKKSLQVF